MAEDTENMDKDPVQMFSPTEVKFGCSLFDPSCPLWANRQFFAHAFAIRASAGSQVCQKKHYTIRGSGMKIGFWKDLPTTARKES